jgi:hypothetical protein
MIVKVKIHNKHEDNNSVKQENNFKFKYETEKREFVIFMGELSQSCYVEFTIVKAHVVSTFDDVEVLSMRDKYFKKYYHTNGDVYIEIDKITFDSDILNKSFLGEKIAQHIKNITGIEHISYTVYPEHPDMNDALDGYAMLSLLTRLKIMKLLRDGEVNTMEKLGFEIDTDMLFDITPNYNCVFMKYKWRD